MPLNSPKLGGVPVSLTLEQYPAITGMLGGLALSLMPPALKTQLLDSSREQTLTAAPASDKLLSHYLTWAGASTERYTGYLPPHFFAKYGMALVAKLTSMVPHNLASVLNQGTRYRVKRLIPSGEKILMRGKLMECTDDGRRVRIHVRITVGWSAEPDAMTVDNYVAVMHGKPDKATTPKRSANEHDYETIGHWSADRDDGKRFAILTGDFNPIHTMEIVGNHSPFRACILQAYGGVARSWEALANAGHGNITDFDVKYVKPNRLPNPSLQVQRSTEPDAQGYRQLRLTDTSGNVYIAGRFLDQSVDKQTS